MASSYALAEYAAQNDKGTGELLPDLNDIREVSKFIAQQVYRQAIEDGVASNRTDEEIAAAIQQNFWEPNYRPYQRVSF